MYNRRDLHNISTERRLADPFYARLCDQAERGASGFDAGTSSLQRAVDAKRSSYESTRLLLKTRGFLAGSNIVDNLRAHLRAIESARSKGLYNTSIETEVDVRARLLGAQQAMREFKP